MGDAGAFRLGQLCHLRGNTTNQIAARLKLGGAINGDLLAVTPAHDSSRLLLSTQMVAYIGAGMSDAQLDAFMDMGLGMTLAFFSTVQERFPELVTWEED